MSTKKIAALAVAALLLIAIFVGAEFGKTQKTILTPGMVSEYASPSP
ncbi:MAG: hypothetical protein LBL25_02225 [Oscillospiraceae bacterium]|jgi:hypothetical protein|nr:hypothetical protein [Oscillospiraceae bacterium]